ncbi:MAG TPA: amino acid permease [Gemmatimonadales bacterium]|nr:amino acid permease [Gemmatimonadales bacterium]
MTTYARRLGLFSGTMAVVGGIIGSGIFTNPKIVADRVGSWQLTLVAWGIGGAVALIGAFCYGELGCRSPRAGGGYVYLRDAWGPLPAFLYGWALLLVMTTGATAAVAVIFANYALPLLGVGPSATVPVAVGAIVLLAGINYVGVKPGAISQNIFTLLKLAALTALIVVGLAYALPGVPPSYAPVHPPAGGAFIALGSALVPVLFATGGWQQTNFIAEEIVEPEKNLPRALVLGVVIVVAVYLLANVAYLRVLGVRGLAATTTPAADVMTRLLGPVGGTVIRVGIAASTFGFLNLVILVTPRVYQAMAADGVFFPQIARLHPVYRTPTIAILLQAVWAVILTLTKSYDQLNDYVVFGDWIFFGSTVATLFVYRAREKKGEASPPAFRTPWYPVLPALFIMSAIWVVESSVTQNLKNAAIGTGLLLLGIPVFLFWKHKTARSQTDG